MFTMNPLTVPNGQYVFDTDMTFKLDRVRDMDRLRKSLDKLKPDVLILDPWYKILTVEDNAAYNRTQDIMDNLIHDTGITIVVVHHDTVPPMDPKTGQPIIRFHPRGPRTVEGWFDSMIQITGDVMTDKRQLRFMSRHSHYLLNPITVELDRNTLWATRLP